MPETIRILAALKKYASDTALASAAGISPTTMRFALATGSLPKVERARERMCRFAELNCDAQSRADLRFLP